MKYLPIRELQRNYKAIVEELNKTDEPVIIISNNQPQFAIVSMKMLQEINL